MIRLLFLLLMTAFPCIQSAPAVAEEAPAFRASDLPVPRFVSLRSERVFARTGPALRYPVRWVYQRDGLPVEIVQEFDTWRKIRDRDGEEGWVHQSMLAGQRTALVIGESEILVRRDPDITASLVVRIEPGAVVTLRECTLAGWCEIDSGGFRGWAERKSLWGIYPNEEFH